MCMCVCVCVYKEKNKRYLIYKEKTLDSENKIKKFSAVLSAAVWQTNKQHSLNNTIICLGQQYKPTKLYYMHF